MFIISHESAIEFWRLVRQYKLPRVGVRRWLSNPQLGIEAVRMGALWNPAGQHPRSACGVSDTASLYGMQVNSVPTRNPFGCSDLTETDVAKTLGASRVPSDGELRDAMQGIGLLMLMSTPLHVLLDDRAKRRYYDHIAAHISTTALPAGALCRVGPDVFVCSPQLAFCQMACKISRPKLVRLGIEMCGGYAIAPRLSRGFADCYPVMTPAIAQSFAGSLTDLRGARQARIAANRLRSASASPSESDFAILAHFPRAEGGRGIPWAELNGWVACGKRLLPAGEGEGYYCDFVWRDDRLVVGCDGREGHSDDQARIRDATKRRELLANGFEVITVVNSQIRSISAMDRITSDIAKVLGIPKRSLDRVNRSNVVALNRELFGTRFRY